MGGAIFIALQLLFHMRSLDITLKLVAKEDTTQPTVSSEKVFPKSGGGPGKV